MAQAMIKCPKCGETDLKMTADGVYVCSICGTKVQDNKIQEILDLLKSRPETYVGNARFRLRRELKEDADDTDFEIVAKQADRILEKGMRFFAEKKFSEALPCFEKAAKKGSTDANRMLGVAYSMGNGTEGRKRRRLGVVKAISIPYRKIKNGSIKSRFLFVFQEI